MEEASKNLIEQAKRHKIAWGWVVACALIPVAYTVGDMVGEQRGKQEMEEFYAFSDSLEASVTTIALEVSSNNGWGTNEVARYADMDACAETASRLRHAAGSRIRYYCVPDGFHVSSEVEPDSARLNALMAEMERKYPADDSTSAESGQ